MKLSQQNKLKIVLSSNDSVKKSNNLLLMFRKTARLSEQGLQQQKKKN